MDMVWQVLLLLAVLLLIWLIFRKIRPWWKKLLLILLNITVIIFLNFKLLIPLHPMIATTGDFEVATGTEYFTYTTENTDYQTSDNLREVPVMLWYPEDLSQANGRLFLFSHGSLGVADSNDSLFNELASHGYVVVSLAHPYHSFTSTLKDGRTINIDFSYMQEVMSAQGSDDLNKAWQDIEAWSQVHENDLKAVIQGIQAEASDHEIFSVLEPNQIILAGHSLGGTAVLALGRELDNILAVMALEAPFTGDIIRVKDNESYEFTNEPYPYPLLHIYSDATWDILDQWVLYEQNNRYLNESDDQYENVHIEGSGHIGLTDLSRVTPVITNLLDGGLNTKSYDVKLKEINEVTLDFLAGL